MSQLLHSRAHGHSGRDLVWYRSWWRFVQQQCRLALQSLLDLGRSPLWTLVTVGVLGLSMTLPATLHLLVKNVQQASRGVNESFEISLFLRNDASKTDIATLVTLLRADQDVSKVRLLDKAAAMVEFKQQSGFGEALSALESNPLPDVLLVTPRQNNPELAEALLARFQQEPLVELAKLDISWLERLAALTQLVQQVVLTLAMLLLTVALLVIGNTIRLSVMDKKAEIEVMKLVGATDSFIQRPFLYTGIWLGLFGGVLAFAVVELMLWWLSSAISRVTHLYQSNFALASLTMTESLVLLASGIALGFIGSYLTVRSHIRHIEPF
jgi:cell division transport system permease protein